MPAFPLQAVNLTHTFEIEMCRFQTRSARIDWWSCRKRHIWATRLLHPKSTRRRRKRRRSFCRHSNFFTTNFTVGCCWQSSAGGSKIKGNSGHVGLGNWGWRSSSQNRRGNAGMWVARAGCTQSGKWCREVALFKFLFRFFTEFPLTDNKPAKWWFHYCNL